MFDGRIYRAAFVPLLFVLVIAGFSLTGRSAALSSTLAPDAFNGARAFGTLQSLSKQFPDRRPGSAGDDELAGYVAQVLRQLGGTAGGGFQVSTRRIRARTLDGAHTLTTVIAERPGSTGEAPIAILAHRDAFGHNASAELSGTAALLELARVFAQSETRRTVVLVSTSGGSGGYTGATDFARHGGHSLDAAIVLGDIAGSVARRPFVLPFSAKSAMAPERLQLTLNSSISREVGVKPGTPAVVSELAHLAFPLATSEQAPLNASGVPSVMVQITGEREPAPNERVDETRLQNFGRAVLSTIYALDEGPDIGQPSGPRLLLGHKSLPGWAVRLLVLALLVPPLIVSVDALARLRRRREPVLRWIVWTLLCALPLLASALLAIVLGALGILTAPPGQPSAGSLPSDGSLLAGALVCVVLTALLAVVAWPRLARAMSLPLRATADGARLATMLVLIVVALLVWTVNPFACLLLVPALHLWPIAVGRRDATRGSRVTAPVALLVSLVPLTLLLVAYAHELGLGLRGLLESAVLTLAGGQVGLFGAVLWCTALGCMLAAVLLIPVKRSKDAEPQEDWFEISTRGPVSYAGPGSLGGTESALRR